MAVQSRYAEWLCSIESSPSKDRQGHEGQEVEGKQDKGAVNAAKGMNRNKVPVLCSIHCLFVSRAFNFLAFVALPVFGQTQESGMNTV
jgi:hypothetical protein